MLYRIKQLLSAHLFQHPHKFKVGLVTVIKTRQEKKKSKNYSNNLGSILNLKCKQEIWLFAEGNNSAFLLIFFSPVNKLHCLKG